MLYKYCPSERVDILAHQKIAFSHRSALNDIFEMRPRVAFNREAYMQARNTVTLQHPHQPVPPETTQEDDEKAVSGTLDEALVLCLSDAWDIIPMWSYYAQAHTGFVIGLDSTHSFFSPFPIKAVTYSVEYPEVNYDVMFSEAWFHKFDQWKHEREWRCVRIRGYGGVPYTLPIRKSSTEEITDVCLYPLPPEIIREIVLGYRITDSDRENILNHLKTDPYTHVDIYEATPDRHAWRLDRKGLAVPWKKAAVV